MCEEKEKAANTANLVNFTHIDEETFNRLRQYIIDMHCMFPDTDTFAAFLYHIFLITETHQEKIQEFDIEFHERIKDFEKEMERIGEDAKSDLTDEVQRLESYIGEVDSQLMEQKDQIKTLEEQIKQLENAN